MPVVRLEYLINKTINRHYVSVFPPKSNSSCCCGLCPQPFLEEECLKTQTDPQEGVPGGKPDSLLCFWGLLQNELPQVDCQSPYLAEQPKQAGPNPQSYAFYRECLQMTFSKQKIPLIGASERKYLSTVMMVCASGLSINTESCLRYCQHLTQVRNEPKQSNFGSHLDACCQHLFRGADIYTSQCVVWLNVIPDISTSICH